jgi:4,5-dihydroxyphthalate decarboxylase
MKLVMGRDDLAAAAQAGAAEAGAALERVAVKPVHKASHGFVNDAAFDVCELAIVTLLQAAAYGRPVLLLPVTTLGRAQHQTLVTRGERGLADLEGARVGVRSWSQTTGVWMRGFLSEQYGVDLRKIDWIVYEGSHVDAYTDPDWVRRAPEGRKLPADFLDGDVEFGIMGNELPDAPGISTVVPDAAEAGAAWSRATGFVPVNHVVGVAEAAAREHAAAVCAAYDAMRDAAARARPAEAPVEVDPHPVGFAALRGPVERAAKYALEQGVLPRPVAYDDLVARTCEALGVPATRLGG